MSNHKIYWDNITDVDHAILLPNGNIIGNSYIMGATVQAESLNGEEQVIIDFSTAKKKFKAFADEIIDHKLWVDLRYNSLTHNQDSVTVYNKKSQTFVATLPADAIYTFNSLSFESSYTWGNSNIDTEIKQYVSNLETNVNNKLGSVIGEKYGLNATIELFACPRPSLHNRFYFRYAHGLPTSTSFGCQNIAHGHLSYIQIRPLNTEANKEIENALKVLKTLLFPYSEGLPNMYYVPRNNGEPNHRIHYHEGTNTLVSEMQTNNRGGMLLEWKCEELNEVTYRCEDQIIEVVDGFSTIENLAEHFRKILMSSFHGRYMLKNFDIQISEGLSKGAFI